MKIRLCYLALLLVSCQNGNPSNPFGGFAGKGCPNVAVGTIHQPSKELTEFVHEQLYQKIDKDSIVGLEFLASHPLLSQTCELLKDVYSIQVKVQWKGSVDYWLLDAHRD